MSFASFGVLRAFRNSLLCITKFDKVAHHVVRCASKTAGTPGIAGLGGKVGKVSATVINVKICALPVETNVERLQTHLCGSNLQKDGGDDVLLKPDKEYPDWLWKLNVGPAPHYSQLTPNDKEYWAQLKRIKKQEQLRIKARLRFS